MAIKAYLKRLIAILLAVIVMFQFTSCGTFSEVVNKTGDAAEKTKNAVVAWYNKIDLSCFENGWNTAKEYMGNAYSAVVTSKYVESVGEAINNLKLDMNNAYGSARGIAQEAGFAAEKWVADTFNIDSAVRNSKYKAQVEGSNKLGSADVSTNYGENASLKYYKTGTGNAQAQAKSLIEAYRNYKNSSNNSISLQDYMDKNGYDVNSQSDLMASIYNGQTRIIPTNHLSEAADYLKGRITKLSSIDGDVASARTQAYQETLAKLKDRLRAPDETESKPVTYEEMQAIAELSQKGEFKPEDYNISLSQVITPKYVMKQAVGTGLEAGLLRAVFTVGPDLISILVNRVKTGNLDDETLKNIGIEGVIATSEGFVEGSVSSMVVNLCKQGVFGESLKGASPNVVAAFVFLIIEALISGYSLAKGEITSEEYGCLMADKILITALAIPVTIMLTAILPASKVCVLIGCFAGGVIASVGYTIVKGITLEFIDGGGFEAIIPEDLAGKVSKTIESAKTAVASLNMSEHFSNLQDFVVSTANDGFVILKGVFE